MHTPLLPPRACPPAVLLLVLLCAPAPAGAGNPASGGVPAPAEPGAGASPGVPLDDAALGALRGGDLVRARVLVDGTVDGNRAERITSGDNRVQGGAFGDAAGINTLIQNTGSNVLIQHGMTVNVQFADPGTP